MNAVAIAIAKWAALGAVFAGGALGVAYLAGPRIVGRLGRAGGEGFAEGAEKVRAALASVNAPTLGRWIG